LSGILDFPFKLSGNLHDPIAAYLQSQHCMDDTKVAANLSGAWALLDNSHIDLWVSWPLSTVKWILGKQLSRCPCASRVPLSFLLKGTSFKWVDAFIPFSLYVVIGSCWFLRCLQDIFPIGPVHSTWLIFSGPRLLSSHTFIGPNFTCTFLDKFHVFQTFHCFSFLLTVLTINLTKSSQQYTCDCFEITLTN
jgi:hypothetical protein